jgi:HEAT repeat protein
MKRTLCIMLLILTSGAFIYAQEAKSGKTAREYITDLSSSGDENTIIQAERWLGEKKVKDAVPGLINLLSDKRETVRIEAAVALGLIGEESSVDALDSALLNDESPQVRYAAMLATMRIGSKKSIEAYKQSKEKETDPFIKDLLAKMEDKLKGK